MTAQLDVVIPVYNEGPLVHSALQALRQHVRASMRILIAYDHDDDDTLTALQAGPAYPFEVLPVKNRGQGVHDAITTAFAVTTAPGVLVWPADDDYNAARIDEMLAGLHRGCDIVAASRFIPGGRMEGCPWLKAVILRTSAAALHHVAGVPTRDPTNGLRLFSRRVIASIPIDSRRGFTYSLELLVKVHRLHWRVCEVPVEWYERTVGRSRFKVIAWLPDYFVWFRYAFATTFLRRGPQTVRRLGPPQSGLPELIDP